MLLSPRWLPWVLMGIALVGFIDATYLAVQYFVKFDLPCSLARGCEVVTTSAYSDILGVPIALLGALYYATILIGTFVAMDMGNAVLFRRVRQLTVTGFLFSVWLVLAQAFLLNAWCQWCLISAGTSTLLFVCAYCAPWKGTAPAPTNT